ncbi:MAG: hypothetical protein LBU40_00245 [Methanobrevibacter sp.]|jgi:hypothetical protein|nr:hypothetical protein [Methanobrevibacter sp.]
MMAIRLRHLFLDRADEVVKSVNDSLKNYTSEEYNSEEISNLIFDRIISEDISARIISYTIDTKQFYSVQYRKKGKWVNFDYNGLDMFFQPVYNKTLNPTNIVKKEMILDG